LLPGCVWFAVTRRYYKNLTNKLRFDIRAAMEQLEAMFFAHPKPRSKSIRGRDKLHWYNDTNDIAQVNLWCENA
jgi:hypothetical protein